MKHQALDVEQTSFARSVVPNLSCRGTVIGILKSFLGLSGSFFTTIYVSFLEPDATSFLLLLAVVPSAIVLVCTFVINFVPYIQVEPHTKVRSAGSPTFE